MSERAGDRGPGARIGRWSAIVLPAVVALGLGLWGLGRRSMFGSEADSYWAAHLPLPHLVRLLRHVDAVHGLYYLLLHGWFAAQPGTGGTSAITWMRIPSVAGMVVAAALTSVVTTRLTGRRWTGLLAGLVYALNPAVSAWGQNGRSYALVSGAVTVMVLLLLRAVDRPDSRARWLAFGAAVTVCGYLHEMTLLLAAAYGVTLLWAGVPRAVLGRWLAATVGGGVLVVPLLYKGERESKAVGYLPRPTLATVREFVHQAFGDNQVVVVLAVVLAVIAVLPALRPHARSGRITVPMLALPMLVVPVVLLMGESRVGHPLYDARYVLYTTIAASMLVAGGVEQVAGVVGRALRRRPGARSAVQPVLALALVVALVLLQAGDLRFLRTPSSRTEDYGAATRYLASHRAPGDGVLFLDPGARNAKLGYPAAFRGVRDLALQRTPEQAGTFRGTGRPVSQTLAAMRSSPRIWVFQRPFQTSEPKGLSGVRNVLARDFRIASVTRFKGVTDVLYVRTGADERA